MSKRVIYPEKVRGLEGAKLGEVWPDRETFLELARSQRIVPVVIRLLADQDTPISLYRKLTAPLGPAGSFLLESAGQGEDSRWSIIGVKARASLTEKDGEARWYGDVPASVPTSGAPLEALRATATAFKSARFDHLPPFTGGLVGFVSYDAVRRIEKLPHQPIDEIGTPELCMLLAEDVAVFDHTDSTVLLVANALNLNGHQSGAEEAYDAALVRIEAMREALRASIETTPVVYSSVESPLSTARTSQTEFEKSVETAIKNIIDGEIFQVVPSQRHTQGTNADPLEVYRVLRRLNPSPYMFLVRAHDGDGKPIDIVGASPETLVTVRDRQASTHPIAGSRPRGVDAEDDERLKNELLADPKDRSEHLMLVDLGRNDLHKVCQAGSVIVRDFMNVVKYSHVMHMISSVTGTLKNGMTAFDALTATFPAGTLTGAPKPRAMQIIDELEPVSRGIYGGTVGYLDFAGDLDMAIAIRTTVMKDGRAHVQAGGGVVADSSPTMEHRESLSKAAAAERAVASAETLRSQ
ncbi:anthranilate synthase component I [Dermabacter vaginalis]|uniref:anthranilate synthase component I n=1 Tax=Dermabacter vaginalis TaxID=1630135 RepID=UPI001EF4031E|nr:anthranilate synthase component I [Dermabacter vaginalis]MCG7442708.1 anthranilate synthase component I [Dermabacter vaginalis]